MSVQRVSGGLEEGAGKSDAVHFVSYVVNFEKLAIIFLFFWNFSSILEKVPS